MNLSRKRFRLLTLAALMCVGQAGAQEHEAPTQAEHESSSAHEHEFKNEIVLGIGLIHEGRDNDIAGAFEYGRRLTDKWSAGIIFERLWGDQTSSIVAVPIVRNFDGWKAMVAPGVERRSSGNEELIRVGASWHVETSIGPVIPIVAVDFLEEETILVLSAGLAFEF